MLAAGGLQLLAVSQFQPLALQASAGLRQRLPSHTRALLPAFFGRAWYVRWRQHLPADPAAALLLQLLRLDWHSARAVLLAIPYPAPLLADDRRGSGSAGRPTPRPSSCSRRPVVAAGSACRPRSSPSSCIRRPDWSAAGSACHRSTSQPFFLHSSAGLRRRPSTSSLLLRLSFQQRQRLSSPSNPWLQARRGRQRLGHPSPSSHRRRVGGRQRIIHSDP